MAFRLVHVSDLHFNTSESGSSAHRHSLEHLESLSSLLAAEEFDRLVVSGDVSNAGDPDSLAEARRYLLDTISTTAKSFGLGLQDCERLVIVPGNHDAFNCVAEPSVWSLWQKSIRNYQKAFPEKPIEGPFGCGYDWIERDGDGLFIAYLDSCYMGEPTTHVPYNPFRWFRRSARGDVSVEQSGELKRYYEDGVRGLLPYPDGSRLIPKERFSAALKILVMHHFLFPPPSKPIDALMRVRQRRDVMLRLALADFDIVLCGHSHVAHTRRTTYAEHLDRRGRKRYMLAYAQRLLGVEEYPRVLGPKQEQYVLSAWSSFVVNVFVKSAFAENADRPIDEAEESIVSELKKVLAPDANFKTLFRERLALLVDSGERMIAGKQLQRLHRRIVSQLTADERRQLARLSGVVPKILRALKQRPFVQFMSGSSAKALAPTSGIRAFSIYDVMPTARGWVVTPMSYTWKADAKTFQPQASPPKPVHFEELRRPMVDQM